MRLDGRMEGARAARVSAVETAGAVGGTLGASADGSRMAALRAMGTESGPCRLAVATFFLGGLRMPVIVDGGSSRMVETEADRFFLRGLRKSSSSSELSSLRLASSRGVRDCGKGEEDRMDV